MRKVLLVMIVVALCFAVASCASITLPAAATSNAVGSKVGTATGKIWLGVFGTADAGIQAAAKNGGITKISTVDITVKLGILGLWTDYEAVVTGE